MLKALIRSTPRLSKLINGLAYEPNLYLFQLEGNRLGFAFLCSPLSGSNGDEGDRLKAGLTVDWPEKTTIQFSLICTENINEMKTGFLRLRRAFRESGRTDLPAETQALLEKVTNARAEYFSDRTMRPVDSISGVRIREQSLVVRAVLKPEHIVEGARCASESDGSGRLPKLPKSGWVGSASSRRNTATNRR